MHPEYWEKPFLGSHISYRRVAHCSFEPDRIRLVRGYSRYNEDLYVEARVCDVSMVSHGGGIMRPEKSEKPISSETSQEG